MAQPQVSLLVQLLKEAQTLHGAALRVFCENYPIYDWSTAPEANALNVQSSSFASYADIAGVPELREALGRRDAIALGLPFLSSDHIAVTVGATHALYVTLCVWRHAGMEVLIPVPGFTGYRDICETLGLEYRPYRVRSDGVFDTEYLLREMREPRIVVLNSPHNPTGGVLADCDLMAIASAIRNSGGVLIFDAVYDTLLYEVAPIRWDVVLSQADDQRNVVRINSFSKSFGLPGLRLGWITASPDFINRAEALIERTVVCVPSANQSYGLIALRWDLEPFVRELRARRDYLCHRLADVPAEFDPPKAGTTLLLRLHHHSGTDMVRKLLTQHKLLLLPGEGYYGGDPLTIRLSFGYPLPAIDEYTTAIKKVLGTM